MRQEIIPGGQCTIEHASAACGIKVNTIRMWETRYGWPRPSRLANGFRVYTHGQVDDLRRVAALLRSGLAISDVIHEGMPRWPANAPGSRPDFAPLLCLPIPERTQPRALHMQIRDALRERRAGALEWSLRYAGACLHPRERAAAAWLPALIGLRLWAATDPFPGAEQLVALIRSETTPAAFAAIQADAEKATP
jgi:DNA-binding transcriptional MerR regulator